MRTKARWGRFHPPSRGETTHVRVLLTRGVGFLGVRSVGNGPVDRVDVAALEPAVNPAEGVRAPEGRFGAG